MRIGRYRMGAVLKRIAYAFVAIFGGVLVIFYAVEPAFNALIGPYVNFHPTQVDWDTVAAIWTAEIPLAFLLTALLERRRELRDRINDDFNNLVMVMEKRGVKDFDQLRYARVFSENWLRGRRERWSWLINTDTGEAYDVRDVSRYWYLASELLIDFHDFDSKETFDSFCGKYRINLNWEELPSISALRPNPEGRKKREAEGVAIPPWS